MRPTDAPIPAWRGAWGLILLGVGFGLLAWTFRVGDPTLQVFRGLPLLAPDAARLLKDPIFTARGNELVMAAGLALAVFGWLGRPGWKVRTTAVGGLVAAALALNLVWFPHIDAENGKLWRLERRQSNRLAKRYSASRHPHLVRHGALLQVPELRGADVYYVDGFEPGPRQVLTLNHPARLWRVDPPDFPVPSAQELLKHYSGFRINLRLSDGPFEFVVFRAREAKPSAYVLIRVGSANLVIPDWLWNRISHLATLAPGG